MTELPIILHERIDDIPIIIGLAKQLGLGRILNHHLGTHGSQQGFNNGQLAVGWLAYMLSQADHRQSAVQEWSMRTAHTLGKLLGEPVRPVDFNDDRLARLLCRLSDDSCWLAIEAELWSATVMVHKIEWSGIRLDSTTSYGYHQVTETGVMQRGLSKDHRPDLPQLKLMAAAAEPMGQLVASDVHAGQCADDPLYLPLVRRVRAMMGQRGLLYSGDCKMAALATRAEIAHHQDYYLMPLPLTGQTAQAFPEWVNNIVDGQQVATLIWDGDQLLAAGYEFEREQTAQSQGESISWTERVQLVRSRSLAHRQQLQLQQRLEKAEAALWALTPKPGQGKRQITTHSQMTEKVNQLLKHYHLTGLLSVHWESQQTTTTHYRGRGRGGPNRPTYTKVQVRCQMIEVRRNHDAITAACHRLGWRVQVTNATTSKLSLAQAVCHYRGGWCLERDFHLVKDLPLALSPLFVWKQEHIVGLTRLLTLALRMLTLLEMRVRQGIEDADEALVGLYEGQPQRTTKRPSGKRILKAFSRAQLTLSRVQVAHQVYWQVTPLSEIHRQMLGYLGLPESLYTKLAQNSK
jgi:transposase